MRKTSLILGIIFTVLSIAAAVFCGILNAGIVYEGEGSIALIAIIPYSFILIPAIIVLTILSLVCAIRLKKSESAKSRLVGNVLLILNIIIIVATLVMIGRIVPLFFS